MKNFYILLLLLFSYTTLHAQLTFQNEFTSYIVGGKAVQQTYDGGYVLLARQLYSTGSHPFSTVIKTNSAGQKTKSIAIIGNNNWDEMKSIQQTFDSGYVLCGESNNGSGWERCQFIRLDKNLDTLWTMYYGSSASNIFGVMACQTSDSGFVGIADEISMGGILLFKTDKNGSLLNGKNITLLSSSQRCTGVQQTSDGGYIVCGNNPPYLMKTDSALNVNWVSQYDNCAYDIKSVQQTIDGGYVFTGESIDYEVLLIKTNSFGDTLWTRKFGNTGIDYGDCVRQTSDGGYIIAGTYREITTNDSYGYLVKTDSLGNLMWSRLFGKHCHFVEQVNDGGYIITGYGSASFGASTCLIKTDTLGFSHCTDSTPVSFTGYLATIKTSPTFVTNSFNSQSRDSLSVFLPGLGETDCLIAHTNEQIYSPRILIVPNPMHNTARIIPDEQFRKGEIFIIDIFGKVVRQILFSGNEILFEREELTKGIYLLKIVSDNGQYVSRLVVD